VFPYYENFVNKQTNKQRKHTSAESERERKRENTQDPTLSLSTVPLLGTRVLHFSVTRYIYFPKIHSDMTLLQPYS